LGKSAKKISELLSNLMQEHKLTRSDIGRGLVILDNLSQQYVWSGSNGKSVKVDRMQVIHAEATCST
jgi:hypothetical protein